MIDQRLDRVVIAFSLDPHQLGQQHADSLAHFLIVGHANVSLAVAVELLDRPRHLVGDVVRNQLPIALVIFLNRVAVRNPPQLSQRDQRRAIVHRLRNFFLVRDQPQFLQLGIPYIPQRHQVGARLLER